MHINLPPSVDRPKVSIVVDNKLSLVVYSAEKLNTFSFSFN